MQERHGDDITIDTRLKVDRAAERLREAGTPKYARAALNEYERQLFNAKSPVRIAKLKLGIERWRLVAERLEVEGRK